MTPALHAALEAARPTLELVPVPILWVTNLAGELVYANRAARAFFELGPEETTGIPLSRFYETTPKRVESLHAILDKGETIHSPRREMRTARGNRRWSNTTCRAVRAPSGEVIALENVVVDVTESVERAQGFEALALASSDVFITLDDELRATYWNRAAEEFTQVPAPAALGRRLVELLPIEGTRPAKAFRAALESRTPLHFEYETTNVRPGAVHEMSVYPLPRGVAIISREISDRVRMQKELASREQLLRAIIDDQEELIGRSLPDGTVTVANRAYAEALGYTPEDLIGKNWLDTMDTQDRERALAAMSALSPDKPTRTFERRTLTGKTLNFKMRGIFDEQRRLVAIQGVGRDLTPLQLALAQKEVLLREIHHRVKNNLQVISSLLNMQFRNVGDPAVLALVLDCQRRIQAMAFVHEHLYRAEELSRLDGAHYLNHLVDGVCASFGEAARHVRVVRRIDQVTLDSETAAPMGTAAAELLSNVIKHAFPGSKHGTVTISLSTRDDTVVLRVQDDGAGIADESRVGQGLGLDIVRHMAAQLGGVMSVRTGPAGTDVSISFPAKRAPRVNP